MKPFVVVHDHAHDIFANGHPMGATGTKLTVQLLAELARRNGRYGMVTMCVGGGQGAAGILENLQR